MDERWLTVSDAWSVYEWIEPRGMPGHRIGRCWVFKQDEVDAWVRSCGAAEKSDNWDTEQ